MGSRLLKKWVVLPLRELAPINARLNMVETLVNNPQYAELLATQLKQIGDIERLVAKIPLGRVNPRQIVQLHRALLTIPVLRNAFDASKIAELQKIADQLNPCTHLTERIGLELLPDPPAAIGKADTIATGVNAELDELRLLKQSGENYLLTLQQREIDRTGIASLKIGFNNVFGYYLEVRNKYKDEAPADWIRKQTLANAERYITPEL
jgi:DNA mismatch repair protein MutS